MKSSVLAVYRETREEKLEESNFILTPISCRLSTVNEQALEGKDRSIMKA